MTLIPNASDLDLFRPDSDGSSAREQLKLSARFAAVYFGALGLANGFDYVVHAGGIQRDRGDDRTVLVLHGKGSGCGRLVRQVQADRLGRVVSIVLVYCPPAWTDSSKSSRAIRATV